MIHGIPASRGHTLPELLAMLGIAAILAVAAVPVFSKLVLESRMNAAVATAMHAINLARQFSATRSEKIRLCGSDDSGSCSDRLDWTGDLLLTAIRTAFARRFPAGGRQPAHPFESASPRVRSRYRLRNARDAHGLRPPWRARGARSHREPQRPPADQRPRCFGSRARRADQAPSRGFTLVEALVALVLMLVGLAGAGIVLGRSIQYERESGTRRMAIRLAGSLAEELRALDRDASQGRSPADTPALRAWTATGRRSPAGRQRRRASTSHPAFRPQYRIRIEWPVAGIGMQRWCCR